MARNTNKKTQKNSLNYICENCNFISSNKNDYVRHISTRKHKILINTNEHTNEKNSTRNMLYECVCGKSYKHMPSLYNHKKKCVFINEHDEQSHPDEPGDEDVEEDESDDKSGAIIEKNDGSEETKINYEKIILELINQNKAMQEQNKVMQETIAELIPKVGNGNINIVNNNNNISNINLLNEKCKDALNIHDFIKMIQVDVNDLIHTSKKGLAAGISNLFLEHYNSLPILERPLWCVDKKRKKLLIKDGEWQEDKDQKKTKEAIKYLGCVQAKNTNKYAKDNPDWFDNERKKDIYMSIVKQTTDTVDDKLDKILNSLTDTIQLTDDVRDKIQQEYI
jgi:hypothetical protein